MQVRTGGPGNKGISMLLIERDMPGVETVQMQCSGVWASGTAYVTFSDVKVPVENLIGVENNGFKQIMYNFNHEVSTPRIVCHRRTSASKYAVYNALVLYTMQFRQSVCYRYTVRSSTRRSGPVCRHDAFPCELLRLGKFETTFSRFSGYAPHFR